MKHKRFIFCIICFFLLIGCSKKEVPVLKVVDTENNKLIVLTGEHTKPDYFHETEFVVLGGSLGGIAAAISICSSGRTAILVEETDRIAGCFTVQDTNYIADNSFIESSGSSKSYQTFRTKIKDWYAGQSQTPPDTFLDLYPYMETFESNGLCFETEAALDVINEMLEEKVRRGNLTVLKRLKVAKVLTFYDRISSVILVDLDDRSVHQITGWMYVDATKTGDLIPIVGLEYSVGFEGRAETNEPHAPEVPDSSGVYDVFYYNDPVQSKLKKEPDQSYQIDLLDNPAGTDTQHQLLVLKKPRRIKGHKRIVEQDISTEFNEGPRARFFEDSVGIGYQPIRIDNNGNTSENTIIETKPFQIPLGALIPVGCRNYLAGGGNISTTAIAGTAYGTPSIEWAVGEAAGEAAAYCAGHTIFTDEFTDKLLHVRGLQKWLVRKRGVPIYWYDDVTPNDDDFVEAQLKPFEDTAYHDVSESLSYRE